MKTPPPRPPWRVWAVAALALGIVGAMATLFFFDPATAGFYPVCAVHELTGLQCPGCGGLRALHQLTHGNIAAAWRLNPFVVALLPVGLWLGLRQAVWMSTGRQWPGILTRPLFGWLLVAAMVVFGIARNLPLRPGF